MTLLLLCSFFFPAANADLNPFVESTSGIGAAQIILPSGNSKPAKAGDFLEKGSQIKVEPGSGVKLQFSNGARILLGAKSHFELGEKEWNVYWITLKAGSIRVSVPKEKLTKANRFRFFLKSKSATLGVRGTEFVVETKDSQTTRFSTLEGNVEVAKERIALLSGKGVSITSGESVEVAENDRKISKPIGFDRELFLKQLKKEGLEFESKTEQAPASSPVVVISKPGSLSGSCSFVSTKEESHCIEFKGKSWAKETVAMGCKGNYSKAGCTQKELIGTCEIMKDSPLEMSFNYYEGVKPELFLEKCENLGGKATPTKE